MFTMELETKIECKGIRADGRLYLSGFGKNIDLSNIPPYFYIEIDFNKIRPRNKGE